MKRSSQLVSRWIAAFPRLIHTLESGAILVILLSALLRGMFWLLADWTIEDGMIVARVVRNAVHSGVFSFNLDQRVSTLTSPLFGLLTALLTFLTGSPLFSAKAIGVVASTLTSLLLYRIFRSVLSQRESLIASMVYVGFPPVIAYSIAGLETSLYTFACCLALERLFQRKNATAVTFAAVCTLIRPDGAILLGLSGSLMLIREGISAKTIWRLTPGIVLLGLGYALHLAYFGSFLPQTVIAKSAGYTINPVQNASKYLNRMFLAQPTGLPIYVLALVGIGYTLLLQRELFVFLAWYVAYHLFFFVRAPLFDWYLQPPLFVIALFAGFGILVSVRYSCKWVGRPCWVGPLQVFSGGFVALALLIALFPYSRGKQAYQLYEDQVRGAAGKWLSENAPKDAVVFTESLGYIGYYSIQEFIDWPGLTNPKIPKILEDSQDSWENSVGRSEQYLTIINEFAPDYLVLREKEWIELSDFLGARYRLCAKFTAPNNTGPNYLIVELED